MRIYSGVVWGSIACGQQGRVPGDCFLSSRRRRGVSADAGALQGLIFVSNETTPAALRSYDHVCLSHEMRKAVIFTEKILWQVPHICHVCNDYVYASYIDK